jgi:hypothetical protein
MLFCRSTGSGFTSRRAQADALGAALKEVAALAFWHRAKLHLCMIMFKFDGCGAVRELEEQLWLTNHLQHIVTHGQFLLLYLVLPKQDACTRTAPSCNRPCVIHPKRC